MDTSVFHIHSGYIEVEYINEIDLDLKLHTMLISSYDFDLFNEEMHKLEKTLEYNLEYKKVRKKFKYFGKKRFEAMFTKKISDNKIKRFLRMKHVEEQPLHQIAASVAKEMEIRDNWLPQYQEGCPYIINIDATTHHIDNISYNPSNKETTLKIVNHVGNNSLRDVQIGDFRVKFN